MRPVHLVVEGITAFRHRQEIDFSDLELFVITGPTGAGKTTIFDAMSLALYGVIPRATRGVDRFISHGASQAIVSLIFEAGGERFQATRRYRTTGAPVQARLERLVDGQEPVGIAQGQRGVTAKVTDLVGMDYDGFKRAVLLPQGEFDLFLTGDAKDRRKVMRGLLGLDHYIAAGEYAREQARLLERTIAEKEQRQQALAHATPEARTQVDAARRAAAERQAALAELLTRVREAGGRRAEHQRLAEELEDAAEGWDGLASQVLQLASETRDSRGQVAAARRDRDGAQATLQKAEEDESTREAERDAVIGHTGSAEDLAAAGRDLETRVTAAGNIATRTTELHSVRADELGATERVNRARKAARTAAEERARAERAAEARAREHEAAKTVNERARRRADLEGQIATARIAAAEAETTRDRARSARDTARAERDAADAALAELQRRHLAAELRSHVHAGEDCPVCDRTVDHVPSVDAGAKEALDAGLERQRKARGDADTAEAALSADEGDLRTAASERDRLVNALEELQEAPVPGGAAKELGAAAKALEDAEADRDESTRREQEATGELEEAKLAAGRASSTRELAEQRLTDAQDAYQRATERLEMLLGRPLPEDPSAELERRRAERAGAENALTQARAAVRSARKDCDQAQAVLDRRLEDEQGRQRRLSTIKGRVEELCARSARKTSWPTLEVPAWPAGVDELEDALAARLEERTDELRDAARAARQRERAAAEEINDLTGEAGLATDHPERDPVQALAEAHENSIASASAKKEQLARLDREIEERSRLDAELTASSSRARRLRWIEGHLRDDATGFVSFVIGESLDTLCGLASARLEEMSEQRYALHADEDGSFQVVDHANASELRDVETLSGGEKFQVSFALALALAESIAGHGDGPARALEAVFIDEGFSALDAESLEVALDSLEAMSHAEQRMIGLISHVERVPERIQDGLKVIKGGDGASRVVRREATALSA